MERKDGVRSDQSHSCRRSRVASKKIGVESKKIEAEEQPKPFQDKRVRTEGSKGSEKCQECMQGVRRQKDKMEGCREAESRLLRDQQDKIAARLKPSRSMEEVKEER